MRHVERQHEDANQKLGAGDQIVHRNVLKDKLGGAGVVCYWRDYLMINFQPQIFEMNADLIRVHLRKSAA